MRTRAIIVLAVGIAAAAALVAMLMGPGPEASTASSHREAPLISEDPSADNTDLYAFRSPDRPDTISIVSNWIPAEDPAAGPMYYQFSQTARYNIYIDRNGDAVPDVTYRFRFGPSAAVAFLRNTVQSYTVTRTVGRSTTTVARGMTPPNNIGPRTTPNYRALAAAGVLPLDGGGQVFAGQREDAFFADIGAIFDSLGFRRGTGITGGGKDFFAGYGVHSIALQIPISQLDDADHTIGVWASTDRQQLSVRTVSSRVRARVRIKNTRRFRTITRTVRRTVVSRPFVQVSRIGNPLVNELIIPTNRKDEWNRATPAQDSRFQGFFTDPVLAALINQLYPGVINAPTSGRDDLVAVLLTGVPNLNFTGTKPADMLRLNMSIAPAATPNRLGVFGGDTAGYPNGRRLEDDVIDISERAVAGKLKMNPNADLLGDGVDANDVLSLGAFPYQNDPSSGFDNTKGQQKP
ncbi:MAG: DUF4331 domain-containing protein [Actinobacteria bacterium]|nr:DUF4331 domain-containing protein [Actinomycetota bacterium]